MADKFLGGEMKVYRSLLVALLVVFAGVSASVAEASRVVIQAPNDPTCGEGGGPNQFTGNTITVDGTMFSNTDFTYCGTTLLDELFVDVTPTKPHDTLFCTLLGTAFNECGVSSDSTPPPPGLIMLDLVCDPTVSACTGLVMGDGVGVAVLTPEPAMTELLLFGLGGLPFLGVVRRTGRKRLNQAVSA
jgi:hypothetical protein